MEVILAALQLLAQIFGAMKAYLELRGSGEGNDDHTGARTTDNRPKHLRE